jgi:GT2 family glycosyltransferase
MNDIDKMKNGFTIGIPTWNRIEFLKLCIESLLKNSYYGFKHEIRIHINGCTDGTREYLDKMCSLYENIKYTYSPKNLGIVEGHNIAIADGTKHFIVMPDNDIFFFPNWDLELVKFAEENGADKTWWLNPMPVEPHGSNICCIAPKNYGLTPKQFNHKQALTDMHILQTTKIPLNSNCTPICLWREPFEKIGGLNKDLEIGIGLEDDLAIRYYREIGCRNFVVVPKSLVYHFQAGITGFQTCENRDHYANLRDAYFKEKYNTTKEEFLFNIMKRGKTWIKE